MKYYCSTIPLPLAEKLKEKGMPIRYAKRLVNACPNSTRRVDVIDNAIVCPMYCEVFDWMIEKKGWLISIDRAWNFGTESIVDAFEYCILRVGPFSSQPMERFERVSTWHEAANAAIEKALTLI